MKGKTFCGSYPMLALAMILLAGCGGPPNPQAGSSTAPSVGNIVTVRYDVTGLLFVLPAPNSVDGPDLSLPPATAPSLFANAIPNYRTAPSQAERIEGLKNYIRENVAPGGWKDPQCTITSEAIDRGKAALLVTNTPTVQREVQSLLEVLQKSFGRQITLEPRLVLFDDEEEQKLPALLQSRLAEVRNAGRYRRDVVLDKLAFSQLKEALEAQLHGVHMGLSGPPRLTLFDGQHAALVVQTQQAYVGDLKEVADTDNSKPGWHYDPVIQTTTATGVVLNMTACQSPDGKTVFVDLHGTCARLLDLITEQFGTGHDGVIGTIQRPVLSVFKIDAACAIPDQAALLLGGTTEIKSGDPDFNANSPSRPATEAKVKELAEKAGHRHLYLVLRPMIVVPKEKPAATYKSAG